MSRITFVYFSLFPFPFSLVMVQDALTVTREIEVGIGIVVVIADGDAKELPLGSDTGIGGHVGEFAFACVAIKRAAGTADQENIQQTVLIVIEEGAAMA